MFDSMYEVLFDSSTSDVCFQCHLFLVKKKMLCCHNFAVLGLERVKKLSNKYIQDWWKKILKHKHSITKSSINFMPMCSLSFITFYFCNVIKLIAHLINHFLLALNDLDHG
ncbi:hypothetical protein Ahy_A06g029394 [Arachis hypogaea]|uniref:SWIM-type domain-containing protein n=1 Tax=Arachis hypogaea TaxID=3818 RepID=A0A445CT41_ARAHY|nr:hypothetical protein Ahy_A06g029394 [Arachis hypogaea]